ncbi:FUSC family protein [Nocardia sp. CA2R105]|uniref:FUSC family protein n=1 Tax=Nocardia coffeae TaxID=2873381 RepID=UPI001CA6F516|nr:FUSC family protein [Nocardia coffeae]MBY8857914.1 FUSC family protein [Nocardia coffeae]
MFPPPHMHLRPVDRSARTLWRAWQVLSLHGVFRMRPAADTWRRSAVSGLIALGVPEVVLVATGHLPLAFYTCAGGLCALYGHGLPYSARARALGWVVFGMIAGVGVALTTAALTESAVVRVLVLALLAGLCKLICDASRIGPPGNVIFTFIISAAGFLPVRLAEVPAHLELVLSGGVLAWVVCMAPALVRPHAPERFAVARALSATARLVRAPAGDPVAARARYDAAAACHAAWHTVRLVPCDTLQGAAEITALIRLLVRAESLAAAAQSGSSDRDRSEFSTTAGYPERTTTPSDGSRHTDAADRAAEADLLTDWARELRSGRAVPEVDCLLTERDQIRGIALQRDAERTPSGIRRVLRAFRPTAPGFPLAVRVSVGAAAAGLVSVALGVDRPYWAVMTAAVLIVANTVMSWHRTVQRLLGNLIGVGLFTALVPLTVHPVALVAVALACQLVVEATISRNYWVASVFVTPMALVMVEFAGAQPAGRLALDRWLDTCVGAAVAVVICFAVPNRRAFDRVALALRELDAVLARARESLSAGRPDHDVRRRLATALVEVRESADIATGEWWSTEVPEERIVASERAGHRLLAQLPVRLPVVVR